MALIDLLRPLDQRVFQPCCMCSIEAAARRTGNENRRRSPKILVRKVAVQPRPDYIALTDTRRLDPVEVISSDGPTLISMAVFFDKTRLIDNIVLNGGL